MLPYLLVFAVDTFDWANDLRELGTVLVEVLHVTDTGLHLLHNFLQLLEGMESLLDTIQLCLDCVSQLGFNGGLYLERERGEGDKDHLLIKPHPSLTCE